MGQKKQKGKGSKKYGRNKLKCEIYRKSHRRFKNKLRRVVRSNGPAAAEAYRKSYAGRE